MKALKQKNGLNRLKSGGSRSGVSSTIFALVIMIVLQCVVWIVVSHSVGVAMPKIFMSWLNILRNNAYAGVIALGMCFIIISGGIDLSVGSMLCAIGAATMYLLDESVGPLAAMGITGPVAYIIAIVASIIMGGLLG